MRLSLMRTICCAAAMTALVAPGVRADEYNKLTYVTFSGPVQVPGITLPAGTYTFKLADPENGRRVIQIWNKENNHLYTTLLTMPNQRMDVPDKPIVMFRETPRGESPAVQAWFYPGDRYGQEFVYPKDQAMKIAKASHEKVLSFAENSTDSGALRGARVGRVEETGQFSNSDAAPNPPAPSANARQSATTTASSTTTAPAATTTAPRSQPVATSGQASSTTARRELPRTASPLPLFELLSGLCLAAAVGVWLLRRQLSAN